MSDNPATPAAFIVLAPRLTDKVGVSSLTTKIPGALFFRPDSDAAAPSIWLLAHTLLTVPDEVERYKIPAIQVFETQAISPPVTIDGKVGDVDRSGVLDKQLRRHRLAKHAHRICHQPAIGHIDHDLVGSARHTYRGKGLSDCHCSA